MKRILALILLGLLLLLPVYAEEGDQVDEIEAVEEEGGTEQNEPSPQVETPTEPEKKEQVEENSQTEDTGQTEAPPQTEDAGQTEAPPQTEDAEQTEAVPGSEDTGEAASQEEGTQAEEDEEKPQSPATEGVLPEMFVVMDEDGALISSSGAGYEIGFSSMEALLIMAALDEKYGQSGDMGTLKVGEDFEPPYGGGLDVIAGEEFGALDLYKALFLKSPADVSLLFALRDFGGEEGLSAALSALASKLGLSSTHIGDIYGLASSSTPYDIARLFLYSYKNSNRFKEASSLKNLNIEGRETTAPRQLNSSSALVLDTGMTVLRKGEESKVFDEGIMVGKTAYADDGTYIVLSLLKVHGRPLVFVSSGNQVPEEAYRRHKVLQERIEEGYELVSYLKVGATVKAFKGEGQNRQPIDMSPKADVFLLLPKNYDVKTKIESRYHAEAQGISQIAVYKEGVLYKVVPALSLGEGEEGSYLGEVRSIDGGRTGKDKALNIVIILAKLFVVLILWLFVVALNRWRIRRAKRRMRAKTRSH